MKRSLPICLIIAEAVLSLLAGPVLADTEEQAIKAAPTEVSLDMLIAQALQQSPAIRAKKRAYEAARSRIVAAWLPDDPMIGVDVEGQSALFRFDRTDNEYMVSQTLPFPTRLWLRGRLAAQEMQKAYQEYKEKEHDIIWHMEQPYYELLLAQKTLTALEETQQLADRLAQAVQARYESNTATQQDLLKAKIESEKIEVERFSQKQKARVAQAHIAHLLDEPLSTAYTIAQPPRGGLAVSLEILEQQALRNRPELKAMETGIRLAKTTRYLAQTRWLPEITGRIEARQFSGEDNIREYDTFLGLSVPVWSLLKGISGEWKGAGKQVEEAQASYAALKNEVLLAVHEAYAKIKTAEHAAVTYETIILPQARQQTEVALSSYEAGRTDLLALVDTQRMLREAQIAYYGYAADYEMGLSDLRLAVGDSIANPKESQP